MGLSWMLSHGAKYGVATNHFLESYRSGTITLTENRVANTQNYAPDQPWDNKETRVTNTQNYVPDQPWGIKEITRRTRVPKHVWRRARSVRPGHKGKESPFLRSLREEGNGGSTPCPDPTWMCGKCAKCGIPNVIGCEHQGDDDSDDESVESLKSVETGRTRFNTATLRADIGSEEWEARRAFGYLHTSLHLGEQLVQFQLPRETTFSNLVFFTEQLLPELPVNTYCMKYDVYLPGASRFMSMQHLYENFADEQVGAFLDNGVLRMRGSIGLRGGAGKKPSGKKQKNKGKKPKQKKLMGKAYPSQNAMTQAMFGVRIPKPATIRGNGKKQKMASGINSALAMSECSARFLRAVIDPFGERNVCLPTAPACASLKSSGFVRFSMSTGTNNVGFVVCNPSWCNDLPQGFYTGPTYSANANLISIMSATNVLYTGVLPIIVSNLPYGTADVTVSNAAYTSDQSTLLQGRVVACGLRITYTGTTINESGVSYCYVDPMHENVFGVSNNGSTLGSLLQTDVKGVTRDPCHMSIYPVNDIEILYGTAAPNNESSSTGQAAATQFFYNMSPSCGGQMPTSTGSVALYNAAEASSLFTGSTVVVPAAIAGYYVNTSAAANFLVEMIVHCEYIGPKVATLATRNIADPVGFAHAQSILQNVPVVKEKNPHMSLKDTLLSSVREIASQLKPVAIGAVVKGMTALLL